jgi:hypothetical protein
MAEKRSVVQRCSAFLFLMFFLIASGCAEVKLGMLPVPPASGGLRVFAKAIIDGDMARVKTTPETYEQKACSMASEFFAERSGVYEIVPVEEVNAVIGSPEIETWRWSQNNWALAVEVARRLYAEYALIVVLVPGSAQRFFLINVTSGKRFEVEQSLKHRHDMVFVQKGYRKSFAELFDRANEDILATADRKSRNISGELAAAREEIQKLTEAPGKIPTADKPAQDGKTSSPTVHDPADKKKEKQIAELEARLAVFSERLAQLDQMKKRIEEQKKQSDILATELAEKKQREKMLVRQLEESSRTAPVIVLSSPEDGTHLEVGFVRIAGVVEDEKGLKRLEIYLNGRPLAKGEDRGVRLTGDTGQKRLEFGKRISLEKGENRITIRATDSDDLLAEKTVTVQYIEQLKNVWAVVIGIDTYPNIRQLKYAANDAGLFYDHLIKHNRIPKENVMLLLNRDATLTKIRSVLGTEIKNKAGKDDMVVIYFAGHGATERDAGSPDGDGLEKYLLSYDADLSDLYATALPMEELSRIFNRIRSERLIFIADACYSGASGGRTIGSGGLRASISESFIDRIAGGRGRVIMSASGANEVSAEKDELRHGVFTYYLIEGLQGLADTDGDGVVTVDEAYAYVSKKVPDATAQEQHPVRKGTVEGRLILSIIP